MAILLKLRGCLGHGLKMCILLGYNPQIIYWNFYHKINLVIFSDQSEYILTSFWITVTLRHQLVPIPLAVQETGTCIPSGDTVTE